MPRDKIYTVSVFDDVLDSNSFSSLSMSLESLLVRFVVVVASRQRLDLVRTLKTLYRSFSHTGLVSFT